ncbi:hypothetical protein ACROYT_G018157 [Oculina patagonica]
MSRVHSADIEDTHSEAPRENEDRTEVMSRDISLTANRDLRRRELSCKLRPILRLMKLTGGYYGDTSLEEFQQANSNLSRFYCVMVLLGQWIVFVQAVTSIFFEGFAQMQNTYFILMFSIWYLQSAAINTVLFLVLPKTQKQPSRFSKFTTSLLASASDFGRMTKRRVYKLLAFTCCAVVFNSICLAALDFYRNTSIARFQPWNGLLVYRLLHFVFSVFNSFAYLLPVVLFGVSCSLLSGMFDNLQKKISTESPSSLNIASLRQEHQKICETVAFADKVFSPFLFVVMCLHIPLICFNFHQLVKSKSSSEDASYLITVFYWWLGISAELAIILVLGTRLNEKIHSFYDILHNISVPDYKEHLELLHFLMHLRGEPIGLSVGGLVVIDKSLALSIVGIIISYLAVLLTLPT